MVVMQVIRIQSIPFHFVMNLSSHLFILYTGNGGHVVFEASNMFNNLSHVKTLIKADDGEDGRSKDRHGKSGEHKIVKVPIGTIVRNPNRKVVGDLDKEGSMFIAARGGAGKNIDI